MPFTFKHLAFAVVAVSGAGAQQPAAAPAGRGLSLSLADAVRLAERESESVRIARAGATRASGQQYQARSRLYPQIGGSASYQRAIQLQFEEIAKRVAPNDTSTGGGDSSSTNAFANSPLARVFASPNTMVLGLTASQILYAGGSVRAGIAAAEAGVRAADIGTRAARAQLTLDVAQAYYDAQVAERLLAIADSSLAQTERALRQTQLARDVGNTAEYDLIRARVQRDNTRPQVIAARTQRDVALLRLRQLLNLQIDAPITLTTPIDAAVPVNASDLRAAASISTSADTSVRSRSSVQQAAEAVRVQENLVRAAKGQRLPNVALSTNYQRFAYPSGVFEESLRLYFPNWTVSLSASIPIFTGGRQHGDQLVAEANLAEARERYQQTVEAATLDARLASAQLEQAEASLAASTGTDEQAARGYAIAEVRFTEGIATQLELTQARVDLETARANRVQAARDVAMARLRVALLNDLPLSGTTAAPATPPRQ